MKALFKGKICEGTHFCGDIIEAILSVQPKKIVDKGGKEIEKMIPEGHGESLAILHYFRNCSTHRSLIRFEPEEVWLEFNQTTGEVNLVPRKEKREDDKTFYYLREPLGKGYILQLPEGLYAEQKNRYNLIPVVLDRLVNHVKSLTEKLLSAAFLLDEIPHDSDINPDRSIKPFPPRVTLTSKNASMLCNEYKQQIPRLTQSRLKIDDSLIIEPVAGKHQYFKGYYKLSIIDNDKELITLRSKEWEKLGKDKVKEEAVKEIINECVRFGLIIVK